MKKNNNAGNVITVIAAAVIAFFAWLVSFIFPEKKSVNDHKKLINYRSEEKRIKEDHNARPRIDSEKAILIYLEKAEYKNEARQINRLKKRIAEENYTSLPQFKFSIAEMALKHFGEIDIIDHKAGTLVGTVRYKKGLAVIIIEVHQDKLNLRTISEKKRLSRKTNKAYISEYMKEYKAFDNRSEK